MNQPSMFDVFVFGHRVWRETWTCLPPLARALRVAGRPGPAHRWSPRLTAVAERYRFPGRLRLDEELVAAAAVDPSGAVRLLEL